MPRPLLINFREDGSIEIEKSVYALPELAALSKLFTPNAVDLLVRLYAYQTPINPYDEPLKREERALSDTQTINRCLLDPTLFDSPEWEAARDRFLIERFDSLVDSFVNFEAKIDEFLKAIATTPVTEMIRKKDAPSPNGRQKKSISDVVFGDDQMEFVRKDNTEALKNFASTLKLYQTQFEDIKQQMLRTKGTKQQRQARAADFKNLAINGN